jgi:hypothetical protein
MSKPLPGDTSLSDLTWVPGEGSSNGKCDGRTQVRPSLFCGSHTSEYGAPLTACDTRAGAMAQPPFKPHPCRIAAMAGLTH